MKEYIISANDVKAIEEEFGIILSFEKDDELIWCKDCKYNSNTEGNYVNCDIIPQMFGKTPDNNYCSYAEPKEK